MTEFYLGQPCVVKPKTFSISSHGQEQPTRGTILYIHPRLRYVMVGVETPGGQLRENFFPEDVQPVESKKRKK